MFLLFLYSYNTKLIILKRFRISEFHENLDIVMVVFLIVGIVAMSCFDMQHAIGNLYVVLWQILFSAWGIFWPIIFILTFIYARFNNETGRLIIVMLLAHFLLLFLVFLFREQSIHINPADSHYRMLLHIAPALFALICISIADEVRKPI
jgi:hypothetical protein